MFSANYELYCPECNQKADTANPMFVRYSVRRLQLPIFLCSSCQTVYIDKPIIRRIIREWREYGLWTKMPLKRLYQEFIGELEKTVTEYWVAHLGYKRARFRKLPKNQSPR